MSKWWSPSTTSFWDSAIVAVAQMPSDKVAITDAEYADLMNKQASGYQIVHNTSTGKPQAVAQSLTDATRTVQALDSEVVHTTGDEEIAGEKTFTTTPIVENAAPSVRCINTGLTKGTNPSALNISNSGWFDKNSKWLGFYGYQVETDGAAKSYLGVYEFDSNSDSAENRAHIGVEYPKNGTPFGFAPTTPTNAQTNEIVTANWVLNSATAAKAAGLVGVLPIENGGTGSGTQNFVDLSSSQTVGGGKTWTANQNIKKSGPYLTFQNTDITKGTAPSATKTTSITFGSNGGTNAANSLAILQNYVEADGNNVVKLAAYNPTASSTENSGLVITYPKGGTPTFTLGGKNVVRSVNGVNADEAGNVSDVAANGGFADKSVVYLRFTNGLQICWAPYVHVASGQRITFPAAFNGNPAITATHRGSGDVRVTCVSESGTSMLIHHTNSNAVQVSFIAIGTWKEVTV